MWYFQSHNLGPYRKKKAYSGIAGMGRSVPIGIVGMGRSLPIGGTFYILSSEVCVRFRRPN